MPWAWFLYKYTDTDMFKKAHLSRAHNLPSILLTDHRFPDILFAGRTVETKRYTSRTETRHQFLLPITCLRGSSLTTSRTRIDRPSYDHHLGEDVVINNHQPPPCTAPGFPCLSSQPMLFLRVGNFHALLCCLAPRGPWESYSGGGHPDPIGPVLVSGNPFLRLPPAVIPVTTRMLSARVTEIGTPGFRETLLHKMNPRSRGAIGVLAIITFTAMATSSPSAFCSFDNGGGNCSVWKSPLRSVR
ncbi:hypothetical protein QR685DRAFT_263407 [Neurospora intermedia]|uniref:Uncharacterized protein n=1 Tax=Neurospora intermedia TaxID=5142 RepID=A0ABR3DDJ6_NEUIN